MRRNKGSRQPNQRPVSCRQQANRQITYLRIAHENQMDLALKLTGFTRSSVRTVEADGVIQVTMDNASDVLRPIR